MSDDPKAMIAQAREFDNNKCLAFPGLASAMITRLADALERATARIPLITGEGEAGSNLVVYDQSGQIVTVLLPGTEMTLPLRISNIP